MTFTGNSSRLPTGLIGASYQVTDYEFGLDSAPGSASAGAGAGKISLHPITITLRQDGNLAALYAMVLSGMQADSAKLTLPGNQPQQVLVTFGRTAVGRIDAVDGTDGQLEQITLITGSIEQLTTKTVTAGFDLMTSRANCQGSCCTAQMLGPYTQAESSWPIEQNAVRIDALDVPIMNSAGGPVGRSSLSGFKVRGPLEATGICAAARIGTSLRGTNTFNIASALSMQFGPRNAMTWESLCTTVPTSIVITAAPQGPIETLTFATSAIRLTSRSFNQADGSVASQSNTTWSFMTNTPDVTCPN